MHGYAVLINTETDAPKRVRRYLKVHHSNVVSINGGAIVETAPESTPVAEPHSFYDAMIIALQLVAATQLAVIFIRILTL